MGFSFTVTLSLSKGFGKLSLTNDYRLFHPRNFQLQPVQFLVQAIGQRQ